MIAKGLGEGGPVCDHFCSKESFTPNMNIFSEENLKFFHSGEESGIEASFEKINGEGEGSYL